MGEHIAVQTLESAGGGISTDAGIVHAELRLRVKLLKRELEHFRIGPATAAVIIDAGDAVADADDADWLIPCGEQGCGFERRCGQQIGAEAEEEKKCAHERIRVA